MFLSHSLHIPGAGRGAGAVRGHHSPKIQRPDKHPALQTQRFGREGGFKAQTLCWGGTVGDSLPKPHWHQGPRVAAVAQGHLLRPQAGSQFGMLVNLQAQGYRSHLQELLVLGEAGEA